MHEGPGNDPVQRPRITSSPAAVLWANDRGSMPDVIADARGLKLCESGSESWSVGESVDLLRPIASVFTMIGEEAGIDMNEP